MSELKSSLSCRGHTTSTVATVHLVPLKPSLVTGLLIMNVQYHRQTCFDLEARCKWVWFFFIFIRHLRPICASSTHTALQWFTLQPHWEDLIHISILCPHALLNSELCFSYSGFQPELENPTCLDYYASN